MASLTRQLSRLIDSKPVDDHDLGVARLFLLDAAANMIAGQNSEAGQKLLKWARDIAPDGDLTRLDAGRKAFLLGGLCHILEMDDLHRASVVHPGCAVAPVIFALAAGGDGIEGLTAFIKGIEATTRVGMAVGPEHYQIWHNTATCGPFGSVIAAAHLLHLDEDQQVNGLGNAGSQSAGLWQFLDSGAETKHMHAGRAAESGLVAAQLAAQGFTGAPEILEGSRGFFKATCVNPPIENLLNDPQGPWQLHQNSIKPWPSCRHTHPAIEVSLRLHKQVNKDIAGIILDTYQAAINLCDRPAPQSVYAAKFSLQHCVATALATGRVDLGSFDAAARAQALTLAEKVTVRCVKDFESPYPENWGSAVTLHFADGSSASEKTNCAKGDPQARLSEDEMFAKAQGLLDYAASQNTADLISQIDAMKSGGKIPDLIALLQETGTGIRN